MPRWLVASALALAGCNSHEVRPTSTAPAPAAPAAPAATTQAVAAGSPASQPAPTPPQEKTMDKGALSPAGDKHPGEILHEDKVDGRTWTRAASEVR